MGWGDTLARQEQETHSGWTFPPTSDAADRISNAIAAMPLVWLEEYLSSPRVAHDQHIYDEACAICKAGHAPGALRVVIDAVLEAALSDPAVADAIRRRLADGSGPEREAMECPNKTQSTAEGIDSGLVGCTACGATVGWWRIDVVRHEVDLYAHIAGTGADPMGGEG